MFAHIWWMELQREDFHHAQIAYLATLAIAQLILSSYSMTRIFFGPFFILPPRITEISSVGFVQSCFRDVTDKKTILDI